MSEPTVVETGAQASILAELAGESLDVDLSSGGGQLECVFGMLEPVRPYLDYVTDVTETAERSDFLDLPGFSSLAEPVATPLDLLTDELAQDLTEGCEATEIASWIVDQVQPGYIGDLARDALTAGLTALRDQNWAAIANCINSWDATADLMASGEADEVARRAREIPDDSRELVSWAPTLPGQ